MSHARTPRRRPVRLARRAAMLVALASLTLPIATLSGCLRDKAARTGEIGHQARRGERFVVRITEVPAVFRSDEQNEFVPAPLIPLATAVVGEGLKFAMGELDAYLKRVAKLYTAEYSTKIAREYTIGSSWIISLVRLVEDESPLTANAKPRAASEGESSAVAEGKKQELAVLEAVYLLESVPVETDSGERRHALVVRPYAARASHAAARLKNKKSSYELSVAFDLFTVGEDEPEKPAKDKELPSEPEFERIAVGSGVHDFRLTLSKDMEHATTFFDDSPLEADRYEWTRALRRAFEEPRQTTGSSADGTLTIDAKASPMVAPGKIVTLEVTSIDNEAAYVWTLVGDDNPEIKRVGQSNVWTFQTDAQHARKVLIFEATATKGDQTATDRVRVHVATAPTLYGDTAVAVMPLPSGVNSNSTLLLEIDIAVTEKDPSRAAERVNNAAEALNNLSPELLKLITKAIDPDSDDGDEGEPDPGE